MTNQPRCWTLGPGLDLEALKTCRHWGEREDNEIARSSPVGPRLSACHSSPQWFVVWKCSESLHIFSAGVWIVGPSNLQSVGSVKEKSQRYATRASRSRRSSLRHPQAASPFQSKEPLLHRPWSHSRTASNAVRALLMGATDVDVASKHGRKVAHAVVWRQTFAV